MEGLLELLTNFFIYASDNNPSALVEDSQKSIFTSTYVTMVLDDVTSIIDSVPHSPATTQHINSLLESIAMRVRQCLYTAGGDYLFWTASIFPLPKVEGLVKPTHGFWQRFWISVQNVAVLFKYDVS